MKRDEITTALIMIVNHAKKYAVTENDNFKEEYQSLIDKDQRSILAEYDRLTAQLEEANAIIMDVANQECTYRDQLDSKCESTYEGLLEYLRKIGEVKGINGRMYKWAKKQC